MIEINWLRLVIVLLVILWRNNVHPQLPNITPVEILDAAKNISAAAAKWGNLADALTSWHLPAVLIVGMVIGALLMNAWRSKQ